METYRVLWFDDEHETLEIIKESAILNGVILVPFCNEEDGIRELDKGLHLYDAVIVDGRFYKKAGQSGDALDDNAWVSVARYFDKWSDKKVMPWFILSGQVSITKSKNTLVEIYKDSRVYDKLVEEDILLLWNDIKIAADQQADTQLRHKYRHVFEVCTEKYIGNEAAKSILYLIKIIDNDNVNFETEEKLNTIRKIIERVFTAFNKIGVLPTEILKGKDGSANNSSKFLCNVHASYIYKQEILPPAIAFLLKNLMQITQDGSHADGDLSIKADQFIKSQPTGYFFKSLVFQLLEILVWLKSYFDNHTDQQRNQLIAVLKEPSSTIIEGYIGQDSFNNYYCGEYLLGYKAVEGRYRVGDKINITEIADNTQPKTSHLYSKFAAKFIKAN